MPSNNTLASSPAAAAPELADVVEQIRRTANAELELPAPVTPQARLLEDLALDSLGLTIIAVDLENRYRIKLGEEDAQGISTVGDLAALVVRRVTEAEAR